VAVFFCLKDPAPSGPVRLARRGQGGTWRRARRRCVWRIITDACRLSSSIFLPATRVEHPTIAVRLQMGGAATTSTGSSFQTLGRCRPSFFDFFVRAHGWASVAARDDPVVPVVGAKKFHDRHLARRLAARREFSRHTENSMPSTRQRIAALP